MTIIYHYEMTDFEEFPEHFKGNTKFKKSLNDLFNLLKDESLISEAIVYLSDNEPVELSFDLLEEDADTQNKIRETVQFVNGQGEPFLFASGT